MNRQTSLLIIVFFPCIISLALCVYLFVLTPKLVNRSATASQVDADTVTYVLHLDPFSLCQLLREPMPESDPLHYMGNLDIHTDSMRMTIGYGSHEARSVCMDSVIWGDDLDLGGLTFQLRDLRLATYIDLTIDWTVDVPTTEQARLAVRDWDGGECNYGEYTSCSAGAILHHDGSVTIHYLLPDSANEYGEYEATRSSLLDIVHKDDM